jgi:hypothetical protein
VIRRARQSPLAGLDSSGNSSWLRSEGSILGRTANGINDKYFDGSFLPIQSEPKVADGREQDWSDGLPRGFGGLHAWLIPRQLEIVTSRKTRFIEDWLLQIRCVS